MIIGVGLNTVSSPNIKDYKTISLSSMSKKNINNQTVLKDIKQAYETIILKIEKYKFSNLKKILKN